ncbi:hypothetical protein K493DRAFT_310355 [Basidiobolus meristosporus CBS 931.73]|uniref:Uncharacterized protein n=1 Tax=Basidiobolus meristosporus CBS 931.73 TaxID=1314790 RepID=A0A1Y1ZA83_9FUNG|nr:hypothetical protein K493DRAFT_310355 [Basidiobolus meristosporus CBS 931.73]|eukprot:ORY06947.1 hypothetical protein K493DRAFT_310355 [Basidiobolus meristosporus CBS 931.73]
MPAISQDSSQENNNAAIKNQDQGNDQQLSDDSSNVDNGKPQNGTNGSHKEEEPGFVKRVISIPLVHDGIELVSSYVHDPNAKYINKVATTVENAANSLYKLSEPYQARLQGPISKVDELGCRSLDFIEAKFPIVKAPTNEVLDSLNQNVVTPVQNTAKNIKERFSNSGSANGNGTATASS